MAVAAIFINLKAPGVMGLAGRSSSVCRASALTSILRELPDDISRIKPVCKSLRSALLSILLIISLVPARHRQ